MNPDNPQFETLNSNRGAAVNAIVKCSYDSKFSDEIFGTLNQVANDPIISVRISALMNLAVLMNLDKEKCLTLFLKFLGNTNDKDVYKYSIDSAQYLARYKFEALYDYFNESMEIEEVQDQIAQILAIGWLNNKKNSYSLLKKVWAKNIKAKAKMVSLAIFNLQDKNGIVRKKCIHLYCKFLKESDNEIVQEYSRVFIRLNPHKFLLYLPLLKIYSTSIVAKKDPHSYYDYLIKCSKYFPVEVLDLIKKYKKYDLPNSFGGPYYDGSEPTKIIIGSYNGIYEKSPFNKRYARKALYLFDQILKEPVFRSGASQVLDSI